MRPPNTILQTRYRLIRKLGHGGMGIVYEALDQRVNCLVALKETSAGDDNESRSAFEREAALLANLRHSALPKVMDYFTEGDGDFLVMEFIPGYDLAELLELRGSPFPQSQVMRWADDLLKVVEYLHSQNPPILHRDIKPSNLKLTKQGEIFLLDFGLAKGSTGQMKTLVTSRSVRGYTPVYASLEQIHGHGTDQRSDLYSLAATLYHLLTAIAPIDAPKRFSVVEDEQADPLEPIEKVNPQVSANVAAVIHRGMSINRRQRPATASEVRKALRNALEEDDQHAAEEEYRRAEEKRQQREDERKRAAEAAAKQAEEERQRQEAETRKREEEQRRKTEQQEREREAAWRAEAEAKRRDEAERQKIAVEEEERTRLRNEAQRRKTEQQEREREAARRAEAEAKRRDEAERERIAVEEVERQRLKDEERRRSEERKREEELLLEANFVVTASAATVRSKEPPASGVSKPTIETLKASIPYKVFSGEDIQDQLNDSRGVSTEVTSPHRSLGPNRTLKVVAVTFIGILSLVLIAWLINKALSKESPPPKTTTGVQASTPSPQIEKPAAPLGMVYIPGGEFMMGRDGGHKDGHEYEEPAHKVEVNPFFIDQYEVTCEDYSQFVKATGYRAPTNWLNGNYPAGSAYKPVTAVTWDDANAYATWARKRLPTEEEWEFAARGTDGRLYPWGNAWIPGLANAEGASGSIADVNMHKGTSPFRVYGMVGNVWEWTSSDFKVYSGSLAKQPPGKNLKVIRGCMYACNADKATAIYRRGWPATDADYNNTGFRCAAGVKR
jgi:formylglycine-generating enzyme required for sulfatase activity